MVIERRLSRRLPAAPSLSLLLVPLLLLPLLLLSLLLATAASAASGAGAATAASDPEAFLERLHAGGIDDTRAVTVERLRFAAGLGTLVLEEGVLVPAEALAGRTVELVFLGKGQLEIEPPNGVEASQLDLFTGAEELNAEFEEAVFTMALEQAVAAILNRAPAELTAQQGERAGELLSAWRDSAERRVLDVDGALVQDAVGDPFYQGYFAGRFDGGELGEFLYVVDPGEREQVTLGQFVSREMDEREARRIERELHREQEEGRLIGRTLEDLGQWDTWLSAHQPGSDGTPRPGVVRFEPSHYRIEAELTGEELDLAATATVTLTAVTGHSRVVPFGAHSDMLIDAVTDGAGQPLPHHRSQEGLLVILPEAPEAGSSVDVAITYHGKMINRVQWRVYTLRDSIGWHPHAGSFDRATYDVTLRWPEALDLIAAGERVDGGEDRTEKWERRRLTTPTAGFGFEVGDYRVLTQQAGHVEIRFAVDRASREVLRRDQDELMESVADALLYYEELFGPYPLDQLTVVTTLRGYSQALLGFISMSSLMMRDEAWLTYLLRLEDPRTVIAHEVAHQWWGHAITWESYRDQWISEAMANYAAVLYARQRLGGDVREGIGPTTGWRRAVTRTIEDGRTIESIGPVVLGRRLHSSVTYRAYQPLVYQKGAVVLDMLARQVGEKQFHQMLGRIAEVANGKVLSTEVFVQLVERLSGQELDPFAEQFIYSTGLPEFYYDYQFEQSGPGEWRIVGEVTQEVPFRYLYRIVESPSGSLDVSRERLDQMEIYDSSLVVPVEIAIFDPDYDEEGDEELGNNYAWSHIRLTGAETELDLPIEYEPREMELNPGNQVFARFFNTRRWPKRNLYYQALDRAGAGNLAAAEERARQALAAPAYAGRGGFGLGSLDDDLVDNEEELYDGLTHHLLTRIHLARGDTAAARESFEASEDGLRGRGDWYRGLLETDQARILLQEGDAEEAYEVMRRTVLRRGETDRIEGHLVLAIAAHLTGHQEVRDEALEEAEERGADVGLLEERIAQVAER